MITPDLSDPNKMFCTRRNQSCFLFSDQKNNINMIFSFSLYQVHFFFFVNQNASIRAGYNRSESGVTEANNVDDSHYCISQQMLIHQVTDDCLVATVMWTSTWLLAARAHSLCYRKQNKTKQNKNNQLPTNVYCCPAKTT